METTNGKRPKLDLALNQEARLKLLKDQCFEGESSYGHYFLYSVDHDGEEKAFFATPEVHQQISASGLKSGDEILVRKVAVQNGKKVNSRIELDVLKKIQMATPVSPGTSNNKPADGDGLKALMERCVRESVEITRSIAGVAWQNEDVQKIASCLFIARSRAN
jgi:hypothetical protein